MKESKKKHFREFSLVVVKLEKQGDHVHMKPVFQPEWMEKVVLLVIPPEAYGYVSSTLLVEIARERGIEGVFVSMNKPYLTAIESFIRCGIFEKILFVDCASILAGDCPSGDRLIVVRNPADLTELTISITKGMDMLPRKKFLVFDSLTTLLIYSELTIATRFAHSLGLRMKLNKITSLFLAVEQETGKEMLKSLSTMADDLVYFGKEKDGRKNVE